jgi:RNA polymerase sigma factor (sigma-70 family)
MGDARFMPARDAGVELLVLAAADGSEAAWASLVERFAGRVQAVARGHRLAPHDVEEVVQITWLRLVECIERLRKPGAVGAWLSTTARRESLHLLEASARLQLTGEELPAAESEEVAPIDRMLVAERRATIATALACLPDRERTLLSTLLSDEVSSYAEISAALDMPVGSIGPTRGRALARLRCDRRLRALAPVAC